ncbi:hypothetical protein T265_01824 [Opisthorchis viverrini]|uniref:Uncharacterized protein n=1 Tax=Opisthorchis viverrini TaxID=6198 RepID=A0A074ZY89_OPIVI|nr:hypothetical protein T265_01824 [Opisthorchis viverrini]KER32046.1 hypothetical protein T265_01824 [Opisthorchis viverrini]
MEKSYNILEIKDNDSEQCWEKTTGTSLSTRFPEHQLAYMRTINLISTGMINTNKNGKRMRGYGIVALY